MPSSISEVIPSMIGVYGVSASQLVDYKALVGDVGDGIPGISSPSRALGSWPLSLAP